MNYRRHFVLAIVISLLCVLCISAGAQTQQTENGQQPPKAQLGASLRDMHPRGSPPKSPVRIEYVYPDSAAEKAGLHPGDIVISMDGVTTDGGTALRASLGKHGAGDKVQLIVMSGSTAPRTIGVTLGPVVDANPTFPSGECLYGYASLYSSFYMGGYVTKGWFIHNDGVFVSQIMPGAELARAGVVAKDRIIAIDGLVVKNTDDLYKAVHTYAPGETIRLKYDHEEKTKEVSVTLGCAPYAPQESQAKIWREMKDKLPLPEIVKREQLLAENSLEEKDLFAASLHYRKALAAYPYWPEGWFDDALVDKELQWWANAAAEMNQYLLLAPNDPDAQMAREEIIIWEEKAKDVTPVATGSR